MSGQVQGLARRSARAAASHPIGAAQVQVLRLAALLAAALLALALGVPAHAESNGPATSSARPTSRPSQPRPITKTTVQVATPRGTAMNGAIGPKQDDPHNPPNPNRVRTLNTAQPTTARTAAVNGAIGPKQDDPHNPPNPNRVRTLNTAQPTGARAAMGNAAIGPKPDEPRTRGVQATGNAASR